MNKFKAWLHSHKAAFIAEKLGVSLATVYTWRAGTSKPEPLFANALIELSKNAFDFNDIYGGGGEK